MDDDPIPAAIPPDELVAHAGFVRRLAGALLRHDADAEDVTQETLAVASARGPRVPAARRSWLASVVRHAAAGLRRRAARRAARERRVARPEATGSTADLLAKAETLRLVAQAVDRLEPNERAVVILRHYDGLAPRDIAARLALPVTTVKSRLQRAHERLRGQLDGPEGPRAERRRALSAFAGLTLVPAAVEGGAFVLAAKGGIMAAGGKFAMATVAALALGVGAWLGRGLLVTEGRPSPSSPPAETTPPLSVEEGRAVARPPALAGGSGRSTPLGGEPAQVLPPPVDLEACDRDLDLFGIVVDRGGQPVAGADLRTLSYPTRRANLLDHETYDRAVEGPRTRSARDGTFSLRLPRGEQVALRVAAEGLATCQRPGCSAGERLRLVMGPPSTLVVALLDEAGRPVPETPVRLFRPAHAGEASFERHATSDVAGHATFEDLPGGVWAWVDPEPKRLGKVMWQRVDLPAEGELRLELVLPTGRLVSGRVTDAGTGAPIAGARVGTNWVLDRSVRTDADGRYEVYGWNAAQGATDLHVVAEGYGRRGIVVGSRDVVDFPLEPGDWIVGRALGPNGAPVPGAIVGVVAIGEQAGSLEGDILGTTTSADDGRFRLTSLRRDQDHALVVMARGFGRYLLDFAPRVGGAGEIDLGDVVLPRARAIEGRVLAGDGAPETGVGVTLEGANADRRRRIGEEPSTRAPWYGQTEEAWTDDLGRFRFRDLSPGNYLLKARRPGRAEATRRVVLPPDRDVLDADVSFGEGREVVIRVTDPAGAPLPGAYVTAHGPAWRERVDGRTGPNGELRVHLPPGDGSLLVSWIAELDAKHRRYLTISNRPLPAAAGEVTVAMEAAELVSGRVVDPAGVALEGVGLAAWRGTTTVGQDRTDAEGRFAMEVSLGGPVTLRVLGQTQRSASVVEAWVGEQPDVEVGATDVVVVGRALPRDRALTVVARSPEGTTLSNLAVYLHSPSGSHRQGRTDDAGRAAFSGLTAERWSISVLPDGAHLGDWLVARVEGAEPVGAEIELRFQRGAPVSGVLLDAEDRPVVGAQLQVLAAIGGPRPLGGATDVRGRFRIAVDPETTLPLRLQVTAERRPAASFEVTTLPAENLSLRLPAPAGK